MFGTSSIYGGQNTMNATMNSSLGSNSAFQTTTSLGQAGNPNKDYEVSGAPDDTISGLAFSPATQSQNFLVSGSWDNQIRLWEVTGANGTYQSMPKAQQAHSGPVLDVRFNDDGTKVLSASVDKTGKIWDLGSNQIIQFAQHDAPIRSVHYVKSPNYSCVLTSSFDKTIKAWDLRSQAPIASVSLPDKAYCVDVHYPMVVAGLANKSIIIYSLENGISQYKVVEAPLKYQLRCVSIFTDKDKLNNPPVGFALGSVEGRVAIQYVNPTNPKDNFTFKCHRGNGTTQNPVNYQEVYVVNDINFHPLYGTLTTVGSDGRYSFWDKDQRTKLKTSEGMDQPITKSAISSRGEMFAYAVGYDWSKGHEFATPTKKPQIFIHNCSEDLKSRRK